FPSVGIDASVLGLPGVGRVGGPCSASGSATQPAVGLGELGLSGGTSMKCRRKVALLASSAFVLQGLLAALPGPAAAHDDMATFFYWKVPLGGPHPEKATPSFGFNMMQADNVWLMPSVKNDVQFVPPPLVDVHFTGGEELSLPSLSFSGVDVGAVVNDALYAGP